MELKPKKCKGIGKAFGFKGCGNKSVKRTYGLCPSCLSDWIGTTEKGKEYIKSLRIVSKKRVEKQEKEKTKRMKEALKNKSYFEKILQKEVNKIVRLTDFSKSCISCEHGHYTPFTRKADAGHYKSIGSNPTLRFHFDNIHKQCSICNTHLSANISGYQKGLVARYGEDYFEKVEALASVHKVLNLSVPEIKEAIKKARFIIKEIENGRDFTRKELTEIINIYNDNN